MTRQFSLSSETEERDLCNALVDGTKIKTADFYEGRPECSNDGIRFKDHSGIHSSRPRVVAAIKFSRATYKKMVQNLAWATAYNLVAIPVAGAFSSTKNSISP